MARPRPPEEGTPGGRVPPGARHEATLRAIFERPTRADVSWRSFVALIRALGGEVTNGRGSRRRIAVGGGRASLHEPHPGHLMAKGAVEDARDFLSSLGIFPWIERP